MRASELFLIEAIKVLKLIESNEKELEALQEVATYFVGEIENQIAELSK